MTPEELDERIEAAARRAYDPKGEQRVHWDHMISQHQDYWRKHVTEHARVLFPELFGCPPTHWIAPMNADGAMQHAIAVYGVPARQWRAARDAYLNREGK